MTSIDIPPFVVQSRWHHALKQALLWGVDSQHGEREACGFFWMDSLGQIWFEAMSNLVKAGHGEFMFEAHKALDFVAGSEASLLGLFHTHPGGSVEPSGADLDMAKRMEGSIWGANFEHWLLAAGAGQQTLVRYDAEGVLTKITGKFVLDNEE